MIELAVALAAQAVATPVFAPPVDTPIAFRYEQVRDRDGERSRYVIERRIVFRADDNGYRAELTQQASSVDRSGDAFARVMARLGAAPIVYRLDRSGRIVGIEQPDALWRRFTAAMSREVGEAAARPLQKLPPAAREAMIATALKDALEPVVAGEGPLPPEPVQVPAAPIAGGAAVTPLPGTREVRRIDDDLLVLTRASGPLRDPVDASASIATDIRVDPRTGLTVERHERIEVRSGKNAQLRDTRISLRYPNTRQETRTTP